MAKTTQQEIEVVIKKLELFRQRFKRDDYETILADAAIPARDAIREEAPVFAESNTKTARSGLRPTSHFITDKSGAKKRVSVGNLQRSIQVFKARKKGTARSAMAGPIVSKKSRVSKLKGGLSVSKRNWASYWTFVYYGSARQPANKFIDRARDKSAALVLQKLKSGIIKYSDDAIKKIFQ